MAVTHKKCTFISLQKVNCKVFLLPQLCDCTAVDLNKVAIKYEHHCDSSRWNGKIRNTCVLSG